MPVVSNVRIVVPLKGHHFVCNCHLMYHVTRSSQNILKSPTVASKPEDMGLKGDAAEHAMHAVLAVLDFFPAGQSLQITAFSLDILPNLHCLQDSPDTPLNFQLDTEYKRIDLHVVLHQQDKNHN